MTSNTASPLARPFPAIPEIGGVTRRIARARYKTWDRCDLTFMTFDEGTSVERGGLVPGTSAAGQGQSACRERGQCQCLYRPARS